MSIIFQRSNINSLGMTLNKITLTGGLHELFTPVNPTEAANGLVDYRVMLVGNNGADILTGMKIYLMSETTSTSSTLEFGVDPTLYVGDAGWPAPLTSRLTPPPDITFYAANSLATAILIGDIPTQGFPGANRLVYLKRIISQGAQALSNDVGTIRVTNAI